MGVDRSDDNAYKQYRLFVKQRLHKEHQEELSGIDEQEGRLRLLAELYQETEADYLTLITLLKEKL